MADYSSSEVARLLDVKESTLRKWTEEFASFLSSGARPTQQRQQHRYTDSDIAILREIKRLMKGRSTYERARQRLSMLLSAETNTKDDKTITAVEMTERARAAKQENASQQALIDEQARHIETQRRLIAQLESEKQIANLQAEESRQQMTDARAQLNKIPHSIRRFFGIENP